MLNKSVENLDAIPKYLLRNFLKWGDREIALRRKKYGIWNEYTWKDHYEYVEYFAFGLISLGLKKGDKVSILGDSDPEWIWAQLAAMAAGGVVVGLFTDSLPEEIKYLIENSDSRFLVARDQEQVDKALKIRDDLPLLEKVIYWDSKGMRNYDDPILYYFYDVVKTGREFAQDHAGHFEDMITGLHGDDIAMIYYTSGTTGQPKGAIRTHKSLIMTIKGALRILPGGPQDNYVAITPPAWLASLMGEAGHPLVGMILNYPEKPETVMNDLHEISPLVYGGGPRLWEGLLSLIQAKIVDAGIITRILYKILLPVGYRVADDHLAGKKSLFHWRILYMIANLFVFGSLRNQLGFRKTKHYYTGSAAISPDTFRYFHAIGCPVRQFYGSTESGSVCGHQGDETNIRFETIGPPIPGSEVRISSEGEIQVRGEGLFSGYYKNHEEFKKVMDDGWFRTGDAGYINDEGHIVYIDRLSELGKLGNGGKYSPQYIEGSLRFSPYLQEAVVIGGEERDYVTVILNIDYGTLGRWAEKNRINYTTYADLSQKEEVAQLILKDVQRVNKVLSEDIKIRKFVLLHKEIDADEAEMTRTKKLKRKFFEKKYKDLISGLYSNVDLVEIKAIVTYRDGKTGSTKTALRIWRVGGSLKS